MTDHKDIIAQGRAVMQGVTEGSWQAENPDDGCQWFVASVVKTKSPDTAICVLREDQAADAAFIAWARNHMAEILDALEAKAAPAKWPKGFFHLTGDTLHLRCATEGCSQRVSARMEVGGIGSAYCEPCILQIIAQTTAAPVGDYAGLVERDALLGKVALAHEWRDSDRERAIKAEAAARESALEALAAYGQAAEAYEAQLKAEAALQEAVGALQRIHGKRCEMDMGDLSADEAIREADETARAFLAKHTKDASHE